MPNQTLQSDAERNRAVRKYKTETEWPVRRSNTVVNVCSQGERMVIERLGSLHKIQEPGIFFTIPFIDRIAFRVDMRERTIGYPPQLAITKDNVSVEVSAVVFLQFVDAEKACYGAANPFVSVMELAKSAMRSVVGELELDQLFHSRHIINNQVRSVVAKPASNWGIRFTRHEVLDVRTDTSISVAMDRQAAAERLRREKVLKAEGEKVELQLKSEGVRIKLENESQGNRTRVENEAKAHAMAVRIKADANATALDTVAASLGKNFGRDAAQIAVARDYIEMYAKIGKESNTIMMGEKAADVNGLMNQAGLAMATPHRHLR